MQVILCCQKPWSEKGMRWAQQSMILFYLTRRNSYAVSFPFLSGGQDGFGMFTDEKKGDKLETFQWSTTIMFRGLKYTPYKNAKGIGRTQSGERLNLERPQEQLSYTMRSLRWLCQVLHTGQVAKGQKTVAVSWNKRFRLDIRNFHTMRTTKQASRKGCAISTPIFKSQMNEFLHHLVWLHSQPCSEQELTWDVLLIPIQPE